MKLRLRGKYTVFIIALIIINIVLLTGASVLQFRGLSDNLTDTSSQLMTEGLMSEVQANGEVITKLLADNLVNPLYRYDMNAIYDILSNYRMSHNVLSLSVYDKEGRIVHDGTKDVANFGSPVLTGSFIKQIIVHRKSLSFLGDNTLEMYYPISLDDTVLGGVQVVFSLDDIRKEIRSTNQRLSEIGAIGLNKSILIMILISLLIILFGVGVSFIVASKISHPINRLVQYAGRVGKGDYSFRLKAKSEDEIGDLIKAFDMMKKSLLVSTVSISELEKQVQSRTRELEKANAELKNHQEKLELTVQERTRALINSKRLLEKEIEDRKAIEEQLIRAQKMEAIGTLAAGVAHDLNNILTGIVGYPDLILSELPEDSPLVNDVLNIKNSGTKAATIVHDLLSLARKSPSFTEIINLEEIVHDYLKSPENASILENHPNIKIQTHFEKNISKISGSPVHLNKVLMNLLYNAIESMPEGGTIDIFLKHKSIDAHGDRSSPYEKGTYAVLEISDRGEGIAPEYLERIFEPFFTTKTLGKSGSGLGLAVVWGTVKDHRGYIEVQSTVGQGTTFSLLFPTTLEQKPEAPKNESAQNYRGNGETILIVEDQEAQRVMLMKILAKLGYNAIVSSSGEEAVEFLKKNSADLMILDMMMEPGMDGLETYRQIISFKPGQKAIVASGYSESSRIQQVQDIGAGYYIRKPYTIQNIGLAVRVELDRT